MPHEAPVTAVQHQYERSALARQIAFMVFVAIMFAGVIALTLAAYGFYRFQATSAKAYSNALTHFKYGSIGAELASGLPYRLLLALPEVFPEYFDNKKDLSSFGFIYEKNAPDHVRLPVGFAMGVRQGVDVAWFNCAVCHTGQVRLPGQSEPQVIAGMPANTVDLQRFFEALFEMAVDKRFSWEGLKGAIGELGPFDRFLWEWAVIPNTRATLIARRSELLPFLDPRQASAAGLKLASGAAVCRAGLKLEASRYQGCRDETKLELPKDYLPSRPEDATRWGPGRVDTFNPYKLIQFQVEADCLTEKERTGVSDFPSVFEQGRRGARRMNLHWDGNNASLDERNLSAALGAGVTEATVQYRSIERVADWLKTLAPPESPYKHGLSDARVRRGKEIYMVQCAACHGHEGNAGYLFEGARLGQIEPIEYVGTDEHRLNSYTATMQKYQTDFLFCADSEHRFRNFKKTNGYANLPLDGLWLRAPYLHNGSVPTLADLLEKPDARPKRFERGHIELDSAKGGFRAPDCSSGYSKGFCFDTSHTGNSNKGHLYGTDLAADDKQDLLQYLLTF